MGGLDHGGRWRRVACTAVLAVLAGACGARGDEGDAAVASPAAPPQPLVLGVAVAQSGVAAPYGQEQLAGAQLAERLLNDGGGIAGRPIQLVVSDTGDEAGGAVSAFQELINTHPVVGIIGPTRAEQAAAAHPVAEQSQVPTLGLSATPEDGSAGGEYVTGVSAPITATAPRAIDGALAQGPVERAAVAFAEDDPFSTAEAVAFQRLLRDRGVPLAAVETFQAGDADLGGEAVVILGADPQLVVISGLGASGVSLARALRERGYQGRIVGGVGFDTAEVFSACGPACQGVLTAQAYSPATVGEIAEAFRTAFEQEQGRPPQQLSAQAFTAVQVFVEALQAVEAAVGLDGLDLVSLRTELNDAVLAGEYETPLGRIRLSPDGIDQESFHLAQIEMDADGRTGRFSFPQ